jgi:transcription antitermination factor NusG
MEAKWYAVYTRPRWEKKVADTLTKKKIENYCPLNRTVRQWSDRKKIVMDPLFTSYVFVRLTEKDLQTVKSIDGIINMVYWLNKPAVIRDNEIDMIRHFLNDHNNVKIERTIVRIDDIVRVTSGPLIEREGSVLFVKNKTVRVSLPSLGYMLIAEVDASHIEKKVPIGPGSIISLSA